ncbi:MAG: hypothetical protein PVG66_04130 [Chromatiales bacterium]|jgi:hypothetical protein
MPIILESVHTDQFGLLSVDLRNEGGSIERSYPITVERGQLLALSVLSAPGALVGPDAAVSLYGEGGEEIIRFQGEQHGLITVSEMLPTRLAINVSGAAPCIVIAGLITRLKQLPRDPVAFFQCEACVQTIKAAIIALLGPAALVADIPDGLIDAIEEGLERLADELELEVQWLKSALKLIRNFGIDKVSFDLCRNQGFCK